MAASSFAVSWHVEPQFARRVRRRPLTSLARRALAAEGAPSPSELSVAIIDDRSMRELNSRYRHVDAATDVLSFAAGTGDGFVTPPRATAHLGDVAISYDTAERQAREAGHDIEDELAHLLVHGILHILGYDHESTGEARAMREREEALLGKAAH